MAYYRYVDCSFLKQVRFSTALGPILLIFLILSVFFCTLHRPSFLTNISYELFFDRRHLQTPLVTGLRIQDPGIGIPSTTFMSKDIIT